MHEEKGGSGCRDQPEAARSSAGNRVLPRQGRSPRGPFGRKEEQSGGKKCIGFGRARGSREMTGTVVGGTIPTLKKSTSESLKPAGTLPYMTKGALQMCLN